MQLLLRARDFIIIINKISSFWLFKNIKKIVIDLLFRYIQIFYLNKCYFFINILLCKIVLSHVSLINIFLYALLQNLHWILIIIIA